MVVKILSRSNTFKESEECVGRVVIQYVSHVGAAAGRKLKLRREGA